MDSFTPLFLTDTPPNLSFVRVSVEATDGTSGVHGFTLWDKGVVITSVKEARGELEIKEEKETHKSNLKRSEKLKLRRNL